MKLPQLSTLVEFLPDPWPSKAATNNLVHGAGDSDDLYIPEYKPYAAAAPLAASNYLGVRLGQHWTIPGATGSGKTRFSVALLEYMRRQYPLIPRYVLDSTSDGMAGVFNPIFVEGNRLPKLLDNGNRTLVWIPDTDDLALYNAWLLRILAARKPCIVLLDETASLLTKSGDAIPGHEKLLKQGRKHGITVINCTQEITKIDTSLFRQMTHYVQFRVGEDVPELAAARRFLHVTKEEQRQPLNPYGFFYRKTSIQSATKEYRDLQEFFRQRGNA